jgi:hypothetical protein
MKPRFLKIWLFIFSFSTCLFVSCNNSQIFSIYIPHNYEGNIYLIFDIKKTNAQKLNSKGSVIFTFMNNPPFEFISDRYNKNLSNLRLSVIDKETGHDIDYSKLGYTYMRTFDNKVDTLLINNNSFVYFTAFITRSFYKKNDSSLIKLKSKYNYQFDELKDAIKKESTSE